MYSPYHILAQVMLMETIPKEIIIMILKFYSCKYKNEYKYGHKKISKESGIDFYNLVCSL